LGFGEEAEEGVLGVGEDAGEGWGGFARNPFKDVGGALGNAGVVVPEKLD
jgi:hypothetical protein